MVKDFEDMLSSVHRILAFDGQTDRQTSCHGIICTMDTRHVVKMFVYLSV